MNELKNKQHQKITQLFQQNTFIQKKLPHVTEQKMAARSDYFLKEISQKTEEKLLSITHVLLEKILLILDQKLGDKQFKSYFVILISVINQILQQEETVLCDDYESYQLYTQYISQKEFQKYEEEIYELLENQAQEFVMSTLS